MKCEKSKAQLYMLHEILELFKDWVFYSTFYADIEFFTDFLAKYLFYTILISGPCIFMRSIKVN